ncbi:M50 family metallopeptidase [Thalassotalea sp. M1531]|uniref:M50 family metallopeptidase n=2 Tax=Thalassotalea algicola TaxID=2716224 RepID=A0A7Y0LB76_9GAMM|nr:M50 family metallopeptidase [Thalassotalea algicola]
MTNQINSSSFFQRYAFWFLLLAAALLRSIPIISLPFNWLESYFHEISHGLAALITGGSIVKIELFPNGAGLCTTIGGSRFFTSFMGYTGAATWGAMLYSLASINQKLTKAVSGALLLLLICSCLLWVRDLLTLVILFLLMALLAVKIRWWQSKWFYYGMQLIGLTVLLNALFSPFYLIDGRNQGDGATLASLTLMPEVVWVAIWVAIALALLYLLAKKQQ